MRVGIRYDTCDGGVGISGGDGGCTGSYSGDGDDFGCGVDVDVGGGGDEHCSQDAAGRDGDSDMLF